MTGLEAVAVEQGDPAVDRPGLAEAGAPALCQAWGSGLSVDDECWALKRREQAGCSGGILRLKGRAAGRSLWRYFEGEEGLEEEGILKWRGC